MSPVAVSADRRFHRAHVKPAHRKSRVRLAVWPIAKAVLTIAIVALIVYRGFVALSEAPGLRIDRILVGGNSRVSAAQVQLALGGLRGQNIVFTDLEEWRQQLLRSPWVRDAAFKRTLPSTVEVIVAEREPVGIARVKARLFLIDDRGSLMDEYGPQYQEFDLPIIDGLEPVGAAGDHPAPDARSELAVRVIQALRVKPQIAKQLSQIDVSDVHNAALIVNNDTAVIYVGEDRFLARLESYLGLAAALRERVADIDYVDLRFDDRMFVRPTTKARPIALDSTSRGRNRVARTSLKKP